MEHVATRPKGTVAKIFMVVSLLLLLPSLFFTWRFYLLRLTILENNNNSMIYRSHSYTVLMYREEHAPDTVSLAPITFTHDKTGEELEFMPDDVEVEPTSLAKITHLGDIYLVKGEYFVTFDQPPEGVYYAVIAAQYIFMYVFGVFAAICGVVFLIALARVLYVKRKVKNEL